MFIHVGENAVKHLDDNEGQHGRASLHSNKVFEAYLYQSTCGLDIFNDEIFDHASEGSGLGIRHNPLHEVTGCVMSCERTTTWQSSVMIAAGGFKSLLKMVLLFAIW